MAQKIQIKRGSKAGLPTLAPGEFGLCTDTKELFVGTSSGNVQISLKTDLTAHINNKSNPHGVTAAQVGADPAGSASAVQTNLTNHINNKANPHNVTAAQVGADPAGTAAAVQQALAQQITALTAQLSGKSSVQTGSYVGTGSSTLNLDLPVEPKALILAGSYQAPLAISGVGNYYCIYDNVSGKSVDVTEFGKHVSLEGENTYSAYNASGSTYFWTVLY